MAWYLKYKNTILVLLDTLVYPSLSKIESKIQYLLISTETKFDFLTSSAFNNFINQFLKNNSFSWTFKTFLQSEINYEVFLDVRQWECECWNVWCFDVNVMRIFLISWMHYLGCRERLELERGEMEQLHSNKWNKKFPQHKLLS